jgi:hypothetical protein
MPAELPHPNYYDLVGDSGRINRSAVLALAWRRTRCERAIHARAGIPCPPWRALLAQELGLAWGWARAIQRGARWGTLHRPDRAAVRRDKAA